MLYGEVKQLFSDMLIWNNKIFGSDLHYNLKTEADKNLLSWRNWFSQVKLFQCLFYKFKLKILFIIYKI
jgi:hypothetical protein